MAVHQTVGVYPNQTFKWNGVLPEHLESHIHYNKTMRFGRALFVDGVCVYPGSLNEEQVAYWTEKIKELPKPTRATIPYH